jgi:A/G-specific adenine glycosylase
VRHGFTHFRLELELLAGNTQDWVDGIWAKPAEFDRYALPTLTKKAIRHAQSALAS